MVAKEIDHRCKYCNSKIPVCDDYCDELCEQAQRGKEMADYE
jgi:hypothetical protein